MDKLKNKQDLKDVCGISYREDGRIIRNKDREFIEDLDLLPLPAYYLMERYISSRDRALFKKRWVYIQTGRGCPYKCTFCASGLMYNNYYRTRSSENIIEEVLFFNKRYKINKFVFGHDHFLINRVFVERVCSFLLQKKININWICSSRIDALDSKLLKTMSKSGCKRICFGIESGSMRIQKSIGKNLNLSLVPEIIKECEKYNISVTLPFIIGLPEERNIDIDATLDLILRLAACHRRHIYIQLRLLAPFAGTDLFEKNKDRLIFTGFWSEMSEGPMIRLKENINLIKKYPLLFSSFYIIKPKNLSTTFLYTTLVTFSNLLHSFPLSFYIVTKELKITPLQLLKDLKKWGREKGLNNNEKITIFCLRLITKHFPHFLKDLCYRNKIPFKLLGYIVEAERKQCNLHFKKSRKIKEYINEERVQKRYGLLSKILQDGRPV